MMVPLCRWCLMACSASQPGWITHRPHPSWGKNGTAGPLHMTWRHFDGILHQHDHLHPVLTYVWGCFCTYHVFACGVCAYRVHITHPQPIHNPQHLLSIRKRGFIKAGTTSSHIIGSGEDWGNPDAVRFFNDEPARHVVSDALVCVWEGTKHIHVLVQQSPQSHHYSLQGVLSLLQVGGNTGMPYAHVLAYQADMALLVEAAQQIADVCGEAEQVAYVQPPSSA